MTPDLSFRAVRAAMFAAVCVLLAALGHVLMSGTALSWWAMSAAFLGTTAAVWPLVYRERGPLTVIAATVAAQAVLHSAFSWAQAVVHPSLQSSTSFVRQWVDYLSGGEGTVQFAQGALRGTHGRGPGNVMSQVPPGTAAPDATSHAHHHMHDMTGMAGATPEATATVMPTGVHDLGGMSAGGMLSAHLLAALLCGLWLAHGEQGAFRVLRAVAGWLRTPLCLLFGRSPAPLPRRTRVHRVRQSRALPQLFLVNAITSRGPPTGFAVV